LIKLVSFIGDIDSFKKVLEESFDTSKIERQGTWEWHGSRIIKWIDEGFSYDKLPFRIFIRGNGKLPFWTFSTLPGKGFCPGAGDCLNYCYSFKSWQYPSAFFRQVMNTLLMRNNREAIQRAWENLPKNDHVRLYIDGDFLNAGEVKFWMELCHRRSDLKVYGYSKSLQAFIVANSAGIEWPDNYTLNLSEGHRYSDATVKRVSNLPIVRGRFVGINVGRVIRSSELGTKEMNSLIREKAKENGLGKVFPCPGKCGTCTAKEHACGSKRFKGIPIVIAIH